MVAGNRNNKTRSVYGENAWPSVWEQYDCFSFTGSLHPLWIDLITLKCSVWSIMFVWCNTLLIIITRSNNWKRQQQLSLWLFCQGVLPGQLDRSWPCFSSSWKIFHNSIIKRCSVMQRPPPRNHLGRSEPGLEEACWLVWAESGDTPWGQS